MPIYSAKDARNLKFKTIPVEKIREFAQRVGLNHAGNNTELIKRLVDLSDIDGRLDNFIKNQYAQKINARRRLISDENLMRELNKVNEFSWGVIQGQLDQKIQAEYVRKIKQNDRQYDVLERTKCT